MFQTFEKVCSDNRWFRTFNRKSDNLGEDGWSGLFFKLLLAVESSFREKGRTSFPHIPPNYPHNGETVDKTSLSKVSDAKNVT